MNFRRRRLALAAFLAFALTPAAAMAQSTKSGWYASVSGAYAIPIDSTVSVKVEGHTGTSKLESKNGFAIMAAAGYDVSESLSVELEFGYRNFKFTKFKGLTVKGPTINGSLDGTLPVKGSLSTLSLMANGIFSQKVWRVKPYVGLGIGVARHSGKFGKQSVEVGGEDFIYDGASEDKFAFAYQAMAGVAYPLSDAVDARLGYR